MKITKEQAVRIEEHHNADTTQLCEEQYAIQDVLDVLGIDYHVTRGNCRRIFKIVFEEDEE